MSAIASVMPAALVERPHRGLALLGEAALHQEAHHVRVLVDQAHILLDAAADHLARGVGGQVDGREDRRPSMSCSRSPIAWKSSDLSVKCR